MDLNTSPPTFGEPVLYEVNVVDTVDLHGIAAEGSREDRTLRARMDRWYGDDIKAHDRAWVMEAGETPPVSDSLASTAPYFVRGVKSTPLVLNVELTALSRQSPVGAIGGR